MPIDRQIMSECLIAGGVCAGLLFAVLVPAEQRLASARAAEAALRADVRIATKAESMMPQYLAAVDQHRVTLESLEHAGRIVRDPGALYEWVHELADRTGVQVDQISPQRSATGGRGAATNDPSKVRPRDHGVSLSISLRGGFAELTTFVHELETVSPLARASLFELMPDRAGSELSAQVSANFLALDLTPLTESEIEYLEAKAMGGIVQ